MTAQLIINADDFGSSAEVNAAVVEARQHGVLTSASLMVNGAGTAEAVEIARRDPRLAVGLHLTLSNGRSALPAPEAPLLVDAGGRFPDSPARAAMRYYFNGRTRSQLRREIEAQFQAFGRMGLPLSHVDGHQHLHLHPVVLPMVIELAKRYKAGGIRIPGEPFWAGVRVDPSGFGRRAVVAAGHAYLRAGCRRLIERAGIATCDRSIGSLVSGGITAEYATAMLSRLRCHKVEVFFHPSIGDSGDKCGPNRGDLEALLDPRLRRFIEESGWELTNYRGLREKVCACDHS